MVFAEEGGADGGDPLFELGRMPHREPAQEAGRIPDESPARRRRHRPAPLGHIALPRLGQLGEGAVGPDHVAERGADGPERLPEGGSRLRLRGLPPEEPCQLLARVGSGLQCQEGEEGDGLAAERGRGLAPVRETHGRGTEQSDDKAGLGHAFAL